MNAYSFLFRIIFAILVIVGISGAFVPLVGHLGHEIGCPFDLNRSVWCAAPLEHFDHWKLALAAIATEIGTILFLLCAAHIYIHLYLPQSRIAIHQGRRGPDPIPLFQELFSQGILNRKAP